MRFLFAVLLIANVVLFGFDQGWFGHAPSQRGREPERLNEEIRPDSITVPRVAGINATGSPAATPEASSPSNPAQSNPGPSDAAPSSREPSN
jgi:hypothetical protein